MIFLSYIAAFSEIGGSWLLIIGLATRFGALAIVGTISVAIYHALVTSGFNIFLLELLLLYFASATSIARALRCSPMRVQKLLDDMVEAGQISRVGDAYTYASPRAAEPMGDPPA